MPRLGCACCWSPPDLSHSLIHAKLVSPEEGVKAICACTSTRNIYRRRLPCGHRRP
jgi:hypothetical protein